MIKITKKVVICAICGKEHASNGFHFHLKKHNMTKQQYIDQYGEIKPIDASERAVEMVTDDIEIVETNADDIDKIVNELDEHIEKTGSILKKVDSKIGGMEVNIGNIEKKKDKLVEKNKPMENIMKEKSVMKRVGGNLEILKQGLSLTAVYVDEYGAVREMREVIAIAIDEHGDYTTMVLDNNGVLVPPASIENYYAVIKGEGKVLKRNLKLLMGKPVRVQVMSRRRETGPPKPVPVQVTTKKGIFGRKGKRGKDEGITDEEAEAFYKEVSELTNE